MITQKKQREVSENLSEEDLRTISIIELGDRLGIESTQVRQFLHPEGWCKISNGNIRDEFLKRFNYYMRYKSTPGWFIPEIFQLVDEPNSTIKGPVLLLYERDIL